MKRLGKVSHYAKQGFLILRSTWVPALNEQVVDKKLRPVGLVKDVFGPIDAPYVAVKPRIQDPSRYVGEVLYVAKRQKKDNRGQKTRKKPKKRPTPKRRG
ncbi:MAG: RNA-binding protein [Thermococcaceae archaeon]|nr:RNA-binding protein [Thermococcaceae archaeon]MDK2913430.1 RNA-binding protein [Thermococcaceae archaeon]